METANWPAIIRRRDIEKLGISAYHFYALAQAGEIEQIAPGIYLRPGELDDTTATLASIALRNSAATICLLSALAFYELTDEIPRRTDIALPRGERTLATRFAPIRWHAFERETFGIGRNLHSVADDIMIGLYSPERTIIDVFRMRHELGSDVANEALKRWLRRRGSIPSSLLRMADSFPKAQLALRSTLEILL